MRINIKKLHPDAVTPSYARLLDSGADITAISMQEDFENKVISYGTGLAIEIPEDYVGLLFPRSSVYKKDLILSNCCGVVDPGFAGEIQFKFKTFPGYCHYHVGDRVGQLIIIHRPKLEFNVVQEFTGYDRGGGFGSSGS